MARSPDEKGERMRVVVLLAGLVVAAGCRESSTTSGGGDASPAKVVPPAADTNVRVLRVGLPFTVAGRLASANSGFGEELGSGPLPKHIAPLIVLDVANNKVIGCAFDKVSREEFTAWVAKTKPGTRLSIRGECVMADHDGYALGHCTMVTGDFPKPIEP